MILATANALSNHHLINHPNHKEVLPRGERRLSAPSHSSAVFVGSWREERKSSVGGAWTITAACPTFADPKSQALFGSLQKEKITQGGAQTAISNLKRHGLFFLLVTSPCSVPSSFEPSPPPHPGFPPPLPPIISPLPPNNEKGIFTPAAKSASKICLIFTADRVESDGVSNRLNPHRHFRAKILNKKH